MRLCKVRISEADIKAEARASGIPVVNLLDPKVHLTLYQRLYRRRRFHLDREFARKIVTANREWRARKRVQVQTQS